MTESRLRNYAGESKKNGRPSGREKYRLCEAIAATSLYDGCLKVEEPKEHGFMEP
ncbi:MAG: hypothetical protein QXO94_01500 [Candidatus Bathyarchaeia archaeon]